MKRRNKIILILLGIIVLFVVAIYVFKASLILYFLRAAIHKQSQGDIVLDMKGIKINWVKDEITLIEPNLEFKNRYLDSAKTINLTHLSFNTIDLQNLHLRKMIFDNLFVADGLVFDKPGIYFVEETGKEQFSFHPEKFLETFSQGSGTGNKLDLEIGEVKIQYGSINIKQDTAQYDLPEIIDFRIILENLNTNPAPEKKAQQILSSDDLIFEIKNLHKIFVSGYHLSIDSVHFSTKDKKISLNGSSLIPDWFEDKGKNRIAISAGRIELYGIDLTEIRGKEDLGIRSIYISNGYFTDYYIDTTPTQVDTAREKGERQLSEVLQQFRLDTLDIQEFQLNQIRADEDSVIQVNHINLSFYDILLDSAIFNDPFARVFFGKLMLNTGSSYLDLKKEQLSIHYDSIYYSSEEGQLTINGIDIHDDNVDTPASLIFQVKELKAGNAYPRLLQSEKFSSLSFILNNPFVEIDLNHPILKPHKSDGPGQHALSILPEIRINNGRIKLTRGQDFNIDLNGFSAYAVNLDLSGGISELNFEDLQLQSDAITASLPSKNISLSTGALIWQDRTLGINNLTARIKSGKDNKNGFLRFKEFRISEIDPVALITDKNLIAGTLLIDSPNISGNFDIPTTTNKANDPQNNPGNRAVFPIGLQLNLFDLKYGVSDASFHHETDTFMVKSRFTIHLEDIDLDKHDSLNNWIQKLTGNVIIEETGVQMLGHKGNFGELFIDFNRGRFRLQELDIHAYQNTDQQKIKIHSFNLSRFDFSELQYARLLKSGKLTFRKLIIDDLSADLKMKMLEPGKKQESDIDQEDGMFKRLLDFRYDTIIWSDMQFRLEYESAQASTTYSIRDLNIKHVKDMSVGDNLIKKIQFSFNDFKLNNDLDDSHLLIKHGHTNPNKQDIVIDSLMGGNFIKVKNPIKVPKGSKTYFQSNRILLKGLYLKDTLPTRLKLGRLEFDEVDLEMVRPDEKKSKPGLNIDIEMFRKYAYLMTALSVDTTIIREIKFHYRATQDTSSQLVWADSIGLMISNINIDTTMFDEDDPDLIENFTVDFKGRSQITKDSLYDIQSGRLHYNFPNHRITIDSLRLTPRFKETEFFQKAIYQTDRMQLFTRQIVCNDFYIEELISDDKIHFGSINLYNADLRMIRDKRYPITPGKHTLMPQDAIRGIGQTMTIDSIKVIDSYVEYGEYTEKSDLPGTIFFDQFNIKAYNFTNDISLIEEKKQFSLSLNARIMGQANFNLSMYFDMSSQENNFWFSARSDEIDLTILNPLTNNIMGVFIKSGKATLDVQGITGNDSLVNGTLIFRYKKLKLALYNREKAKVNRGFFSPIMNFLINDIAISSNNPKLLGKERVGQVYFERNTTKSVANYTWKSIMSGMMSTAGINTREQRKEKRELKRE